MDELSLLVGPSIRAARRVARRPKFTLPAADFTASLDYIDSLASRRALALSRRDVAIITTAASNGFDYLSPLFVNKAVPSPSNDGFRVSSDFRPLGDARRFDPEYFVRPPRALVRSSSRVVASRVSPVRSPLRASFPPGWRNPLDPTRDIDDLNRAMRESERRVLRRPFKNYFERPNQIVICLKRKIRRAIMHASGFAGGTNSGFRPPTRTYYSSVIC